MVFMINTSMIIIRQRQNREIAVKLISNKFRSCFRLSAHTPRTIALTLATVG